MSLRVVGNVEFYVLTNRFYSTRLETRTKESNFYASVLVENPVRVMKVNRIGRNFAPTTDHVEVYFPRFEYEHNG